MNLIQLLFLTVVLLFFIGFLFRRIKNASSNLQSDLSQIGHIKNILDIIICSIIILWIVLVFVIIMLKLI